MSGYEVQFCFRRFAVCLDVYVLGWGGVGVGWVVVYAYTLGRIFSLQTAACE